MGLQVCGVDSDSVIEVKVVPVHLLTNVLPEAREHLERVVEASHGDITYESIRNELVNGQAQLIAVFKGHKVIAAVTVNVTTMDSGKRVLMAPVVGGDEMELWLDDVMNLLNKMAKDTCCDTIRGIGRAGWTRQLKKYGWKPTMTIVEFEV